jgi:hypothetical protein
VWMMEPATCRNCEESVVHAPVYFDGKAFCCVGCVSGGPCACTYDGDVPEPTVVEAAAPRRHVVTAPQVTTDQATLPQPAVPQPAVPQPTVPQPTVDRAPAPHATTDQPTTDQAPVRPAALAAGARPLAERAPVPARDPIPLRPAPSVAVIIHVTGFVEQRELLAFAGAIEAEPSLVEVALTRISDTDAWFTARAVSTDAAAAVLTRVPGFDVEVMTDQNLVEVFVTAQRPTRVPEPEPSTEEPSDAPVLPPRPRFRVFNPSNRGIESASPMREATPGAPIPDRPAAQLPERPASPPPAPGPRLVPAAEVRPPAPAATAEPSAPERPVPMARPAAQAPVSAPPARRAVTPNGTASRPAQDEYVEPHARPGGAVTTSEHLTLIVYPFQSFAALNEFQAAIRGLHGVKGTRVRRFYRGTLHLAVDYEDMIPLVERLNDLRGFGLEITSETRSEVEIVIRETGSLAAAGGN